MFDSCSEFHTTALSHILRGNFAALERMAPPLEESAVFPLWRHVLDFCLSDVRRLSKLTVDANSTVPPHHHQQQSRDAISASTSALLERKFDAAATTADECAAMADALLAESSAYPANDAALRNPPRGWPAESWQPMCSRAVVTIAAAALFTVALSKLSAPAALADSRQQDTNNSGSDNDRRRVRSDLLVRRSRALYLTPGTHAEALRAADLALRSAELAMAADPRNLGAYRAGVLSALKAGYPRELDQVARGIFDHGVMMARGARCDEYRALGALWSGTSVPPSAVLAAVEECGSPAPAAKVATPSTPTPKLPPGMMIDDGGATATVSATAEAARRQESSGAGAEATWAELLEVATPAHRDRILLYTLTRNLVPDRFRDDLARAKQCGAATRPYQVPPPLLLLPSPPASAPQWPPLRTLQPAAATGDGGGGGGGDGKPSVEQPPPLTLPLIQCVLLSGAGEGTSGAAAGVGAGVGPSPGPDPGPIREVVRRTDDPCFTFPCCVFDAVALRVATGGIPYRIATLSGPPLGRFNSGRCDNVFVTRATMARADAPPEGEGGDANYARSAQEQQQGQLRERAFLFEGNIGAALLFRADGMPTTAAEARALWDFMGDALAEVAAAGVAVSAALSERSLRHWQDARHLPVQREPRAMVQFFAS